MSVAGGVGQVILEGAVTVVSVEEAEVGLAAREIVPGAGERRCGCTALGQREYIS